MKIIFKLSQLIPFSTRSVISTCTLESLMIYGNLHEVIEITIHFIDYKLAKFVPNTIYKHFPIVFTPHNFEFTMCDTYALVDRWLEVKIKYPECAFLPLPPPLVLAVVLIGIKVPCWIAVMGRLNIILGSTVVRPKLTGIALWYLLQPVPNFSIFAKQEFKWKHNLLTIRLNMLGYGCKSRGNQFND